MAPLNSGNWHVWLFWKLNLCTYVFWASLASWFCLQIWVAGSKFWARIWLQDIFELLSETWVKFSSSKRNSSDYQAKSLGFLPAQTNERSSFRHFLTLAHQGVPNVYENKEEIFKPNWKVSHALCSPLFKVDHFKIEDCDAHFAAKRWIMTECFGFSQECHPLTLKHYCFLVFLRKVSLFGMKMAP